MINYKKIVSLIIMVCLIFSTISFADPSEWAKTSYYSLRYEQLIDNSLTVDRLFQKNITREEFIEMLIKVYLEELRINIESVNYDDYFSDTDNPYIEYAYKMKIVNGVEEKKFLPYKNVTREEMAVMMKNVLNQLKLTNINYKESVFIDRYNISNWAVDAVDYCYDNSLINGVGNNTFKPKDNATREQAFKLIDNIYNRYNLKVAFNKDNPTNKLGNFLTYKGNETNLNIYKDNNELVIVSKGIAPFGENLNIKEDHYQIFRILESNENISFVAVDKVVEVINDLFNNVEKKYQDKIFFIDKDTGRLIFKDNNNCIKIISDKQLEIRVKLY